MKKLLLYLILFFLFFIFSESVSAATLTICPSGCQYAGGEGIQQAIDAAKSGDTIVIQPGNYTKGTYVSEGGIQCFIDTKGKDLVIQGAGSTIDGQNDEIGTGIAGLFRTGICAYGGQVTIDSMTIKQTLGPAIIANKSRVIIKNVTFLDIDNSVISLRQSQAGIYNNLFTGSAGSGIVYGDTSYARIENNTMLPGGGAPGISLTFCNNGQPTADINNNIVVTRGSMTGIGIGCKNDNPDKLAGIKSSNNFVWKAEGGDCFGVPSGPSQYPDCATDELCTGVTFAYPDFVGDGSEAGTVCTWGDGPLYSGGATPKQGSLAASAGNSAGPCASAASSTCTNYIQNNPLPSPAAVPTGMITNIPPGGPGTTGGPTPGGGGQQQGQINFNKILLSPFYMYSTAAATMSAQPKSIEHELFLYIVMSVVYLMVIHFAVAIGNEFNLWFMSTFFVLGAVVGWWMGSWMGGFALAVILSLLFW